MAKQEGDAPARTIEDSIAGTAPETVETEPVRAETEQVTDETKQVTDETKPTEPAKADSQATPGIIQKKYVFEYAYDILSGVKLERTITVSVEADTEGEAIQSASLAAVKLCKVGEYPRYTGRFTRTENGF